MALVMALPVAAQEGSAGKLIDSAMAAALAPLNAWQKCLFTFAGGVASGNVEPAATVAKAALAVCIPYENQAFEALSSFDPHVATPKFDPRPIWRNFVADDLWPTIRQNMEDKTVGAVLAARARQ